MKITALLVFVLLIVSKMTYAKEGDLYDFLWLDPDKKVYVLQNKVYKKAGSFYFNVSAAMDISSSFQDTTGGTVDAGYYINEEWAIEAYYSAYTHSDNDSYKSVIYVNGSEPFVRRINSTYGLLAIWSPFYGKINTFNKIFYFDWSFGAGPAFIDAESNIDSASDSSLINQYKSETFTGLKLKTDFKFHFTEQFHVGTGFSQVHYYAKTPQGSEKRKSNSEFFVSIGMSF